MYTDDHDLDHTLSDYTKGGNFQSSCMWIGLDRCQMISATWCTQPWAASTSPPASWCSSTYGYTSRRRHEPEEALGKTLGLDLENQISTIETPQVQIPTVTCDLASDISTSEAGDTAPPPPDERKDHLKVVTSAQVMKNPLASCPHRSSTFSVNGELQLQQTRGRAPSVAIDVDMVSELEPSSSDSGVVSRCGGVKPLKLRIFKKTDKRQEKQPSKSELEPALPKPHKPRDPEREKKRLARKKEKRATLILGLIMGSFIACWLPFFFLYILKAACRNCVIPSNAFAIAFWLGYMNSVLNPVIYTIFNKDFRRAFRRILFK
ncbi:unnamed protein product [Diatraea saccharalis]|uniref:G-protein coupled receptors family 1 profile domain-containing protein n=1 Tax=Diatraea saccharalis TaxID=40085 RepID=A0A9N9RC29_9NEOP|nr:unnamed protein product [Diatraea saccharalis]